jgi:hypothetical protein
MTIGRRKSAHAGGHSPASKWSRTRNGRPAERWPSWTPPGTDETAAWAFARSPYLAALWPLIGRRWAGLGPRLAVGRLWTIMGSGGSAGLSCCC